MEIERPLEHIEHLLADIDRLTVGAQGNVRPGCPQLEHRRHPG